MNQFQDCPSHLQIRSETLEIVYLLQQNPNWELVNEFKEGDFLKTEGDDYIYLSFSDLQILHFSNPIYDELNQKNQKDSIEKLHLIKRMKNLNQLNSEVLEALLKNSIQIPMEVNQKIMVKGKKINFLYLIIEGEITIYDQLKQYIAMKQGQIFGEEIITNNTIAQQTFKCSQKGSLLRIDYDYLIANDIRYGSQKQELNTFIRLNLANRVSYTSKVMPLNFISNQLEQNRIKRNTSPKRESPKKIKQNLKNSMDFTNIDITRNDITRNDTTYDASLSQLKHDLSGHQTSKIIQDKTIFFENQDDIPKKRQFLPSIPYSSPLTQKNKLPSYVGTKYQKQKKTYEFFSEKVKEKKTLHSGIDRKRIDIMEQQDHIRAMIEKTLHMSLQADLNHSGISFHKNTSIHQAQDSSNPNLAEVKKQDIKILGKKYATSMIEIKDIFRQKMEALKEFKHIQGDWDEYLQERLDKNDYYLKIE